jgi:hypothetical protein
VRRVSLAQVWVLVFHLLVSRWVIVYLNSVYFLALVLLISHLLFFGVTQRYIWRKWR